MIDDSIDTSSWPSIVTQVDDAADVWGDHLADEACLLVDPLPAGSVQRLEGHLDAQLEIEGEPDVAHATAAEQPADLVALVEHCAGCRLRTRPVGRLLIGLHALECARLSIETWHPRTRFRDWWLGYSPNC